MHSSASEKTRFQFCLEWRLTLFAMLMVSGMVSLGFWQLDRAEDKREIAARLQAAQQVPPISIAELDSEGGTLAYRPVKVEGEFLTDRIIFIDNRLWAGKFGYEVVVPLVQTNHQLVLINRGWVPGDPARQSLPEIDIPPGKLQLSAHVYVPPGEAYILGEQHIKSWPAVLQALDMKLIAAALKRELFPYSLRLEKDTVAALQIDWKIVNQQPGKHTAYAVQWFCMAFALMVIFVWHSSNLQDLLRGKSED